MTNVPEIGRKVSVSATVLYAGDFGLLRLRLPNGDIWQCHVSCLEDNSRKADEALKSLDVSVDKLEKAVLGHK